MGFHVILKYLDLIKKICDLTHIPIIASGGISSLADIKSIISIMDKGVSGLIIGKAIYEKLIAIEEIVQLEENYGLS